MQSYQLDLLDEKALVILRGLEQLRIITLKPLSSENKVKETDQHDSFESTNDTVHDPQKGGWKSLQGAVVSPSSEDVENYLKQTREDWE